MRLLDSEQTGKQARYVISEIPWSAPAQSSFLCAQISTSKNIFKLKYMYS